MSKISKSAGRKRVLSYFLLTFLITTLVVPPFSGRASEEMDLDTVLDSYTDPLAIGETVDEEGQAEDVLSGDIIDIEDYEDPVLPANVFAAPEIGSVTDAEAIAAAGAALEIEAKSAILMEFETGKILFEKDADLALPPASVTKVMTMLLVMEEIDSGTLKYTDMVITSERAASMGGSQVYLKVGESMTVEDMLKAVAVASANDATVALAEHICGSEEAFVEKMNERAQALGMKNTTFKNTNGLDVEGHVTSARDIAIMSRELLKHPDILKYTGIWMDSLRGGEFGLSNTNKLIRFYSGANGLKTGSTSIAKYCISASAKRGDLQLIAVVLAAPTTDLRFSNAKRMLDYGFATCAIAKMKAEELSPVKALGGKTDSVICKYDDVSILVKKGSETKIEKIVELAEVLNAPITEGQKAGVVRYMLDGQEVGRADIYTTQTIDRIDYFGIIGEMLKKILLK